MAWVRIDDQFTDHPKASEAGPLGIAMQVAALCYSNRHLTDGFISYAVAARLLDWTGIAKDLDWDKPDQQVMGWKISWQEVAEKCEDAGLWDAVDGGWIIHDYLEYNPSKADAHAKRQDISAKRSQAGRKGLANRWQTDSKTPSNEEQNHSPNPNPNPNPEPTPEERKTTPNGVADETPAALSERQLLHREMFGALSDAFGQPAPGQEKTRYEAAAKALVAAGATPGEIPHLHEAWGWINPGPPRVNSLAGQLTVLRKATPDQRENGRASPNGNGRAAPVTFTQQTVANNEAASEEFLAIAEGMTRGSSAVQRPNGSPRRGLPG